jgi:hypothetical protein
VTAVIRSIYFHKADISTSKGQDELSRRELYIAEILAEGFYFNAGRSKQGTES